MRTPPFTSLLRSFTNRCGKPRGADCSWRAQRQHYIWGDKERLEAPTSSLRTLNSRQWCTIDSTSPKSQFKIRSKCSTGESGREAVCFQFPLLELTCNIYFFLSTEDSRPGKSTENWVQSVQGDTSALHPCLPASLPRFHCWTPGPHFHWHRRWWR